MLNELGISLGTAVVVLTALYFVIKWAVRNGIEESRSEIRKAVKNGMEDYYNENKGDDGYEKR